MEEKLIPYVLKSTYLSIFICTTGVVKVTYGIIKDNNLVFILGLLCVITGYLLIRRKLKEHIRDTQ
jgi:hypothetical protein